MDDATEQSFVSSNDQMIFGLLAHSRGLSLCQVWNQFAAYLPASREDSHIMSAKGGEGIPEKMQ